MIGGTALLIALGSIAVYRVLYSKAKGRLMTVPAAKLPRTEARSGLAFTALVGMGAVSIGTLLNSVVGISLGDSSATTVALLISSFIALALTALASVYMIYRLDLRTGGIRRRVKALEVGWREP